MFRYHEKECHGQPRSQISCLSKRIVKWLYVYISPLLRDNSYAIYTTHLKYTTQWILTCFEHNEFYIFFYHAQKTFLSISIYSPSSPTPSSFRQPLIYSLSLHLCSKGGWLVGFIMSKCTYNQFNSIKHITSLGNHHGHPSPKLYSSSRTDTLSPFHNDSLLHLPHLPLATTILLSVSMNLTMLVPRIYDVPSYMMI